jgi:hypothetical protein
MIDVLVHFEPLEDDATKAVWWAESPQVEGWSAVADHLKELLALVRVGLPFYLEQDDVTFTPCLVPAPAQGAGNPQRAEFLDPTSQPELPLSRGAETNQVMRLVPTGA